jgi:hypothetical protein
MLRLTWITVLAIAGSWLLLLLPWVTIDETTLTGAELSDLLTLAPGLAILILLTSLYGKGVRFLQLFAALALLASGIFAIVSDFSRSPASIQAQEAISGLAGEDGLAQQLATPLIFGLSQLVVALFCLYLLKKPVAMRKSSQTIDDSDPRGIWESQS